MKCKKCHDIEKEHGSYHNHIDETIYLCPWCSSAFENANSTLLSFLNDDECDLIKNKVAKGVIQARISRHNGKSAWQDVK